MNRPSFTPPLAHITSGSKRCLLYGALLTTLAVLLAHASIYAFLTDDAYISFRYASNLSDGYGLVFNPGFERVEGYTNFLWVLILAGFNTLGLAPESAAPILTVTLTIVLWLIVTRFACRHAVDTGAVWLVVVPPLFLAVTRSVAVWSTSALETRLFEVLVVGGVLRLAVELHAKVAQNGQLRPLAVVLFALATLTRPDGLLISLSALAVAAVQLQRRRRLTVRDFTLHVLIYCAIVGGHLAFRLAYYGEWLPNTYYAKVDGRTWWDIGFVYLGAFALEYAAYLWLPLLAGAVHYHYTRKTLYVPALCAAVIVPHALYVAAVGGDHFEYRPLDLYFPLIFLLLYDGARHLFRSTVPAVCVVVSLAAVLVGLIALPYQSHRQFPQRYIAGFPGSANTTPAAAEFMQPANDPVYRLPLLRTIAAWHRSLLDTSTAHFAGIRQEEHKLFLDKVRLDGVHLKELVDDGRVPPDFHIAIGSVGAIPYYSGLPTLDRTGLTDKHVARSEFVDRKGWVAHGKSATLDYARRAGVDFWSLGVHVCWNVADPKFVSVFPGADAVADVGDGYYLLGRFPQGFAAAAARLPALSLEHPSPTTMYRIAQALRTKHQPQTALPLFESALRGAKQLLPEGDQLRSIMRAAYGACLVELERYEEAELQLAAAYAMMQQSPTRSDAVVRRLLTELIAVYDKLGRDDEAERYRQSLHQVDD